MLGFLQVQHFRNIQSCELHLHPRLNWIIGENGSGKTSLLECIHCLSSSRSFRTNNHQHLISHHESKTHIFAETGGLSKIRLGVGLSREDGKEVRINGEKARTSSELAVQLPVQVITPKVSQLIEGGPIERRRFLDWGVFHVEHFYRDALARFTRVLKQRNALLRESAAKNLVSAWDKEFVELAHRLTQARRNYVESLMEKVESLCQSFDHLPSIRFSLFQGWQDGDSLEAKLKESWAADIRRGQTQFGPHRADLRIKTESALARDELSRGQLKLLSCVLILGQLQVLGDMAKQSVILIDDISAEFDTQNRQRILQVALESGAQLFVTGTSKQQLQNLVSEHPNKLFHVEHGIFTEVI